jgi:CheY-like chemotaxis protein
VSPIATRTGLTRPREDSNLRTRLRRALLYPLSYEGRCGSVSVIPEGPSPYSWAVPKVLVVDDDPVIVRLLEVNFEMEGFEVVSAVDGADGVEKARAEQPDIVVSDVMMPKVSGLELCERLKADDATAGIPVVLLSAKAQVTDIRAGLDAGADDYVTKPFEPLDLIDRVNKLLA